MGIKVKNEKIEGKEKNELTEINKTAGNYNLTIRKLNVNSQTFDLNTAYSSGSRAFNYRLSGNPDYGFRGDGRVYEVFGDTQSFKTTIVLQTIREFIKKYKKNVYYFMVEEGFIDKLPLYILDDECKDYFFIVECYDDKELARAEGILQYIGELCKENKDNIGLIVVDSVDALATIAESEKDLDERNMAVLATALSNFFTKYILAIKKSKIDVFFINQIRTNIGGYGQDYFTPGGKALKFYSFIRIMCSSILSELDFRDNEEKYGSWVKLKIVKNKQYPPYKTCKIFIPFGKRIDLAEDLIQLGYYNGTFLLKEKDDSGKVIEKQFKQFYWKDEMSFVLNKEGNPQLFNRESFIQKLYKEKEFALKVKESVYKKFLIEKAVDYLKIEGLEFE